MTKEFTFPQNFLWGAATAAHQVEGNNINSESWVLEHLPETFYAEPSGDACDHYHRYPDDIALLAELGFKVLLPRPGNLSRHVRSHVAAAAAVLAEGRPIGR